MTKSLININGVIRDMSELTFPATGLENMEAFVLNGNLVSVDPIKLAALKEAEAQSIADELTDTDDRMMALAFAAVDLVMADIPPGATTQQVRQQFKDRVLYYLRERRGL